MEKIYFTQEDIDRLSVAEEHFRTVIRAQWKRATSRQMNDLVADIYENRTGKRLHRNWSCASCCFNAFKTVGMLYYESIEHLQQVQTETEPYGIIEFVDDDVADKKTKRFRGRPMRKKYERAK